MTTLRLAHRAFDGFEQALARQIAHFRERHPDVEIETHALELPELYRELVTDGGLAGGRWDVAIVITDWMSQLMTDGLVRELDGELATDPPEDWPHGWSESVLRLQRDRAGRVHGLPYHDGPEVLIYRTDLFGDPAERAAFERRHGRPLAPPATWEEFTEVAAFFHRPEQDLYGCVVAAYPDGHNTVYDFLLQLWARGGDLLDAGGNPTFDGPEGIAALEWLRDLVVTRGLTQPDPLADESVRSGERFASGRAAMMWNWLGFAVVAERGESPIRGKIACAPLPGAAPGQAGATLSTYWVSTIAAGSRHPDLAYAFLRETASPAMDRVTAEAGAVGCRLSTWRDPEIRRALPPYEVLEDANAQARNLPQTAALPQVFEALNSAIDSVYRGAAEPAGALRTAAAQLGVHANR